MDDSAPPLEMEVITGGGAGGGDWGYLGSDGMAGNSSQASPFPTGILSTPASASMHLPKDPAPFDLNADPSPSPIAPAPHAFHNLGSSIPFHGPAQFLGAPPQPPPPSPEDQKGGFLVTPTQPLPITMGMGWDDNEEIEQSLDASSMPITAASLENAAGAEPGEGSGAGGSGSGSGSGRGNKTGMPSKNLMAERLRRKKINERLFILRSVVPKITKMSRASIVSDAIEYMKELKQKAHDLQIEIESASNSSLVGPTSASFPTPNGQPSTVDVRMREGRAVNIHMFCASKPGIAVSTVRALDNLGLDIEQATMSCFEGFAMDVFRAQRCVDGPGPVPEDIKAALMRSAGPQNW